MAGRGAHAVQAFLVPKAGKEQGVAEEKLFLPNNLWIQAAATAAVDFSSMSAPNLDLVTASTYLLWGARRVV